MNYRRNKKNRPFGIFLAAAMLAEQLAAFAPAITAHAEEETDYTLEHRITSAWEGGYNAEITLTNLSEKESEDWTVTFCTADEITGLWGGQITEHLEFPAAGTDEEPDGIDNAGEDAYNGYHQYTVSAEAYNAGLFMGGQATIGYTADGEGQEI